MDFAKYLHPTYGEVQAPIDPPIKNTGVFIGQKSTDYVAGKVGGLNYEIVNPEGDWRPYVVLGEPQSFPNFDSFGCTGFANNNTAEIQLKFYTGHEFNFSDEALNYLADCSPTGNYVYKPADWARKNGRILQESWTIVNPPSWIEYHKPVPQDVQSKSIKFNESYEWVDTSRTSLDFHLKQAPLLLIIGAGSFNHNVVAVKANNTGIWYFDSYDPWLKVTTQTPLSALKLIVKPMSNTQFVKKAGTQEYGFYVPALSEDALKDKAMNFGKPEIVNPEGTIDFSQAKEISGL